jgi:hypothetical protein
MDKALMHYIKGELLSHSVIVVLGIIYIVLAFILHSLHTDIFQGLAYSLVPFGVVFMATNLRQTMGSYKKSVSLANSSKNDINAMLKLEEKEIQSFLESYNKHVTLFSGMFVLSMIIIFACFFGSSNTHLAGLTTGICMTSVILLCSHLITGFRKRLFLHEINKYFS